MDVLLRPMRKELDSELAMDESVMVRPEWSISSRLVEMYAGDGVGHRDARRRCGRPVR